MSSAAATEEPQTSIYETVIENGDLEQALEKRQQLKDKAKAANKLARDADAVARNEIEKLELGLDAAVRCGRFVVALRAVAAKEVSFTTDPTTRLTIRKLDDDA